MPVMHMGACPEFRLKQKLIQAKKFPPGGGKYISLCFSGLGKCRHGWLAVSWEEFLSSVGWVCPSMQQTQKNKWAYLGGVQWTHHQALSPLITLALLLTKDREI